MRDAAMPIDAPVDRAMAASDGRPAPADVNVAAADMACTRWAMVRCTQIRTCTMGFVITRDYSSDSSCQSIHKADCMRGLTYPWTGDTVARVTACTNAHMAQTCDDYLLDVEPTVCADPPGGIENGGICLSDRQCNSTFCRIAGNQLCGVCEAEAIEGGACAAEGQCPFGQLCAGGVCVKGAAMGAACNGTKPCQGRLACVGNVGGVDGTCQKLIPTEASDCDASRATRSNCESRLALYCKVAPAATDAGMSMAGKCTRQTLAATGQTCGTMTDGTVIACNNGGTCQRQLLDASTSRYPTGMCVADVGVGMTCNTSTNFGPGCTVGLRCVTMQGSSGTCRDRLQSACPMM